MLAAHVVVTAQVVDAQLVNAEQQLLPLQFPQLVLATPVGVKPAANASHNTKVEAMHTRKTTIQTVLTMSASGKSMT